VRLSRPVGMNQSRRIGERWRMRSIGRAYETTVSGEAILPGA
jgi:hypothetical protein